MVGFGKGGRAQISREESPMQHGSEEPRCDHARRQQGVHDQPGGRLFLPKYFRWLAPPSVPRASGAWPCRRRCWWGRPSPGCQRWESSSLDRGSSPCQLAKRATKLRITAGHEADADLGPVISPQAKVGLSNGRCFKMDSSGTDLLPDPVRGGRGSRADDRRTGGGSTYISEICWTVSDILDKYSNILWMASRLAETSQVPQP